MNNTEFTEAMMKGLAKGLDEVLNGKNTPDEEKKQGFILMVFEIDNHDGRCNYVSNCKRNDVYVLLKEQVTKFEGMPDIKGHS